MANSRIRLCTHLSVQVDICDAIQGKLVALGSILVDVSGGQAREFLHRFVITGDGSKLNGHQQIIFPMHMQRLERQQRN